MIANGVVAQMHLHLTNLSEVIGASVGGRVMLHYRPLNLLYKRRACFDVKNIHLLICTVDVYSSGITKAAR
jgi:hypothetical protein